MTPWAAGLGLLVSFTATAGTERPDRVGLASEHTARIASPLPSGTALLEADGGSARQDHERATDPTSGASTASSGPDAERGVVPAPETGSGTATDTAHSDAVPEMPPQSDGSTPAIPRAVALSSTTPAPADATPIEVAAASLVIPGLSHRFERKEPAAAAPVDAVPDASRPRYADLIVPESMDREQRCLAEAVYFEARSEPEAGQAAVAQVVLNRVKSGLYPTNVCGVVYQNRHRYMGCQFSFACEGKALRIADGPSWQSATRIASAVIEGRTYLSEVGGATHYHADYVKPGWSRRLTKKDVIGRHIFYQLKRGQT